MDVQLRPGTRFPEGSDLVAKEAGSAEPGPDWPVWTGWLPQLRFAAVTWGCRVDRGKCLWWTQPLARAAGQAEKTHGVPAAFQSLLGHNHRAQTRHQHSGGFCSERLVPCHARGAGTGSSTNRLSWQHLGLLV